MKFLFVVAALAAMGSTASAVTVTVTGQTQPWDPILNSGASFGANDGLAPTSVDASDGLNFSEGAVLYVEALSGETKAWPAGAWVDANGYLTYAANFGKGASGNFFPSKYFDFATYPSYLNALIGTFADASGVIVGTPFEIGLSKQLIVPTGAVQLLMGVNDDLFADNSGALTVSVTNTPLAAVPVPASLPLLLGSVSLLALRRRKE